MRRILQLIDSLEAGGAERMAVNYANSLSSRIEFSALVATRKEGALKVQLNEKVAYLFLGKKRIIDIKAIFKLRQFVKDNRVQIIHAHSTSFFTALLLKIFHPRIKIFWHDHYGNNEFLDKRESSVLKIGSYFFEGILSVNQKLKIWAEENLNCPHVIYLQNFVYVDTNPAGKTILKGNDNKRIVCLANLRMQKNHFFILDLAVKLKRDFPDWTFHLVGKDFEDDYSDQIKKEINIKELLDSVFLYGSKDDIENILAQASIVILTSVSEGLPVALLEYGYYGKAVISTNVGEISSVLSHNFNGFLIENQNREAFYEKLTFLIKNEDIRVELGENLKNSIKKDYCPDTVMEKYLNFLKK